MVPMENSHKPMLFLLHIQAEIVHTLNYSHKPMPSTLFESMFLLHMHAKVVPTGTPSMNPYPECSHYGTFLLKVQAEMVPIWNFHKQTPGTLPTEYFLIHIPVSYTHLTLPTRRTV